MAVKLHRCKARWAKSAGHPCWRVESALRDQGIEYEVVTVSLLKGRRAEIERLTGQRRVPVIEFEDGSVYREESAAMAERIRSGRLFAEEPG